MSTKQQKGFAVMTVEEKARISSLGGRAAHRMGKAHKWTEEEARAAGKKGGNAAHKPRRKPWQIEADKANEAKASEGTPLETPSKEP